MLTLYSNLYIDTLLPKIEPGRKSDLAAHTSYTSLYFAKGVTKSDIIENKEETQLFKDMWSGSSGQILSKIEKDSLTTRRNEKLVPFGAGTFQKEAERSLLPGNRTRHDKT